MIDTSKWGEFRVGDYFHGIRGTSRKLQSLSIGDTPVIAAARYNQGIAGFYDIPSEYKNAITISCNGVGCGSAFYHDYPFAITGDAIVLENRGEVPQEALHYLAAIFDVHFIRKYNYGDKCSADKAEAEIVKLPITLNGQPDWQYMESYMKTITEETEECLENLKKANSTARPIDISKWGKFRIGDLFEKLDTSYLGTGIKTKNVSKIPDDEFTIPLSYAKRYNNGIMYWGRKGEWRTHKNALTIVYNGAVSAGRVYAQSEETGVLAESYMIGLKGVTASFLTYLFLQRIVENCIYSRYSYSDLAVWGSVQNNTIYLPVDANNKPDWQYMEEYMRSIMRESDSSMTELQSRI